VSDGRSRLARWRVSIGFASAVVVLWLAQPTGTSLALGALVGVLGEGLRIWAAGHLNKSREVTASGPYRWLAHPLYVGSCVMGAGLAIASGRIMAAALIAVYLGATIRAAVKSEEAFLRRTFDDHYDRYRRGEVVERRSFSVARAMANREHRTVIGLLLAGLLLGLKATYNGLFWRAAAGQ